MRAEELQGKLADAQATITMLQGALDAVATERTDEMVSALLTASAGMRSESFARERARRFAA